MAALLVPRKSERELEPVHEFLPGANSAFWRRGCFSTGVHLQGIIFDVDGTLVDSNDIHARCWIEAFAHFGKDLNLDVVRHQIGKGGDLLVPDLLNAKEMRRFGDELKKYRSKLYKKKYMPQVKPFPGVTDHLRALDRRGVKIALASSANPDEVQYYIDLLGIGDLLEASTSKKDAEFSKPSPEIFDAALERLGTDPEFTFVAGDTPYDILAAHRAALPVAAVLSGGFERELLTKAEFLFDDVEELVRKIDIVDDYFSN
jgi:HAD superfamily hydrolase (TIGR01549 family)